MRFSVVGAIGLGVGLGMFGMAQAAPPVAAEQQAGKPKPELAQKPLSIPASPPVLNPRTTFKIAHGELITLTGQSLSTNDKSELPYVVFTNGGARQKAEASSTSTALVFRVPNSAKTGSLYVDNGSPQAQGSMRPVTVIKAVKWEKDFFDTGIGHDLRVDLVNLKLQTGPGEQSKFVPSEAMKALGSKDWPFGIPTYEEEIQTSEVVTTPDVPKCADWVSRDPVKRKDQTCPYTNSKTVNGPRFKLAMDLVDLNLNAIDVKIRGPEIVIKVGFEERDKELRGRVTKQPVNGGPIVTIPVTGEMTNMKAEIVLGIKVTEVTRDGSVRVKVLDAEVRSFDFNCDVKMDAWNREIPDALMDSLKVKQRLVNGIRTKGAEGMAASGMTGVLGIHMTNFLRAVSFPPPNAVAAGPNDQLIIESAPIL